MLLLQETKLKKVKANVLQSFWGNSEIEYVHVDAEGSAVPLQFYLESLSISLNF